MIIQDKMELACGCKGTTIKAPEPTPTQTEIKTNQNG